ncbi:5-dehydro-2-deoxygluconokinase [soil metagenome]
MRDIDVVTIGSMMAEISPPEHSQRVTRTESLVIVQAGSATTFSIAFVRLGGKLGLISRVGNDEIGAWMRETLASEGVETSEIRTVQNQLTPVSLASVDAAGNKAFAYYRFPGFSEPLGTLQERDIPDSYLQRASVFDLTESSLRTAQSREVALTLARRARDLGCRVCVNPNFRRTAWKGGAEEAAETLRDALALGTLAVMNEEEALLISGVFTMDRAVTWIQSEGPDLVAITRGERPAMIVNRDQVLEIPVPPTAVVFDIGAGDTFHAGFLVRWCEGAEPTDCARFAIKAAELKIQRPPMIDQLPTRAEVDRALASDAEA